MFVFTNVTYEKPGGSENLVFLIAKHLMEEYGEPVKLFGSKNSYLIKRLYEEGIGFQYYDIDDDKSYKAVSGDDVLILFNNYYGLNKFRGSDCRILVWNILCPVVIGWNNFEFEIKMFGRHVFKVFFNKALLRSLLKKKAFLCMDGSTEGCVEQFLEEKISVDVVPIPIEAGENIYIGRENLDNKGRENVSLSYIGRGDVYWKVNPLKKIISDLSSIEHDFVLNIFTSETDLYDEVLLPLLPENVTIRYQLGYYGKRLRERLVEVSELNFSMGTSALESAVVGIPTILVDATDTDLPKDYMYRWLYETEKYSLGYHYTPDLQEKLPGCEMHAVIDLILDPVSCDAQSKKCWEYTNGNHTVRNTVAMLKKHEGYVSMKHIILYTPNMWIKSRSK